MLHYTLLYRHVERRLSTGLIYVCANRFCCFTPQLYKAKGKAQELESVLSESDKQKFLFILNERTKEELLMTAGLGQVSTNAIIELRTKNGPFKSLEELFHTIKKFPRKQLLKIFLKNGGELPLKKSCHPSKYLTMEQRDNVQSIVSIDLGIKNCAWIHITRDLRVLDWQKQEILFTKPYKPALLAKEVKEFVTCLPKADVYLIELQSFRPSVSGAVYPFIVVLRVLEVLIHCFLLDSLVFSIPAQKVKDFFQLQSGKNKKASSVQTVRMYLKEMQDSYKYFSVELKGRKKVTDDFFDRHTTLGINSVVDVFSVLQIPDELLQQFAESKKKDDFADCFLQGLYFMIDEELVRLPKSPQVN